MDYYKHASKFLEDELDQLLKNSELSLTEASEVLCSTLRMEQKAQEIFRNSLLFWRMHAFPAMKRARELACSAAEWNRYYHLLGVHVVCALGYYWIVTKSVCLRRISQSDAALAIRTVSRLPNLCCGKADIGLN